MTKTIKNFLTLKGDTGILMKEVYGYNISRIAEWLDGLMVELLDGLMVFPVISFCLKPTIKQ
jgi:hypothetical protein